MTPDEPVANQSKGKTLPWSTLLFNIRAKKNDVASDYERLQTAWVIDDNPPTVHSGLLVKKKRHQWSIELPNEPYSFTYPLYVMFETEDHAKTTLSALIRAMNRH